jgi:large subunit ribosomal protein L21
MYAIIRTGGKQAKVRPGDVIDVELLKTADEQVSFTPLLVVDESGTAISDRGALATMPVVAKILGESKGPKIDIFKYKNKTGYRRRAGHRQRYTQIEVVSIGGAKGDAQKATAMTAAPKKDAPKAAEPKVEEPADSGEEE